MHEKIQFQFKGEEREKKKDQQMVLRHNTEYVLCLLVLSEVVFLMVLIAKTKSFINN